MSFTLEQLDQFQKQINRDQPGSPMVGAVTVPWEGKFPKALSASTITDFSLIVDSGVSDHMSESRSLFYSYKNCS